MKSRSQKTTPYSSLPKRLLVWTAVFMSSILIVFTFSETAHAGLFSFMSTLIGSEQVSASINRMPHSANSQTLAILTAATNQDPNPNKSFEIVPVDGGETLVADLAGNNATSTDISNTEISTYIVREGDTISGVAKMFNVSVSTILWANDLTGKSVLRAGQTLVVLPISGITYTIKKGDTLKAIALKYHADSTDILNYNDLTLSSALIAGQTIIIPDAEVSTPLPTQNVSGSRKITKAPNEPLLDGWNWPALPGYFIRPVVNGVKTQGLHGHNGIDFGAPVGTPIIASAAGTVIISKMNGAWNGGYGNYIVISHPNGTQTLYAHMSKGTVSIGEQVSQSERIGYSGNTGLSTGPHLHFEIRGAQNPF